MREMNSLDGLSVLLFYLLTVLWISLSCGYTAERPGMRQPMKKTHTGYSCFPRKQRTGRESTVTVARILLFLWMTHSPPRPLLTLSFTFLSQAALYKIVSKRDTAWQEQMNVCVVSGEPDPHEQHSFALSPSCLHCEWFITNRQLVRKANSVCCSWVRGRSRQTGHRQTGEVSIVNGRFVQE